MNNTDKDKMAEELINLSKVLQTELRIGEELLRVSKTQKEHLNDPNMDELNATSQRCESLLSKLMNLEDERRRITVNISSPLGIPCQELTISGIIGVLGNDDHTLTNELIGIKNRLSSVFQQLMVCSRVNQYLVSRSLRFVEDRIKILRYSLKKTNTYAATGEKEEVTEPAILNQEI